MTEKRIKLKKINNEALVGTGNISVLTSHQDITGKEDKSNKSSSISTDTGSTTKYPTVKAVEDYAQAKGNYLTSADISGKLDIAQTSNKGKNVVVDSTSGNITFEDKPTIPADVSDLTDSSNTAFTPKSHTHGNLQNDGSVGTSNNASKNVVTDANGKITTEAKPTIPTASSTIPSADSTSGAIGSGTTWAKADHQHPKSSIYAEATHNHTKSQITDFPTIPSDVADLTDSSNTAFTPKSHTHGNLQNDGKIKISGTAQASKNVVTDANGNITTEDKPTIPSASSTTPSADTQNGSYGSGTSYARANHTHPKSSLYAEANHTHSNYLTSHQDISGKEDKSNKVTSWSNTTTDTHYPSEKLVKESIDSVLYTTEELELGTPTTSSNAEFKFSFYGDKSFTISTLNTVGLPSPSFSYDSSFDSIEIDLDISFPSQNFILIFYSAVVNDLAIFGYNGSTYFGRYDSDQYAEYNLVDVAQLYMGSKLTLQFSNYGIRAFFNDEDHTYIDIEYSIYQIKYSDNVTINSITAKEWNIPTLLSRFVDDIPKIEHLQGDADLNELYSDKIYLGSNNSYYHISNCPVENASFVLTNRNITSPDEHSNKAVQQILMSTRYGENIQLWVRYHSQYGSGSSWIKLMNAADIDSSWINNSTNPVQSQLIKSALDGKSDTSHTHGNLSSDGKISNSNSDTFQYFVGIGNSTNSLYKAHNLRADKVKDINEHTNISTSANATQDTINTAIDAALESKIEKGIIDGGVNLCVGEPSSSGSDGNVFGVDSSTFHNKKVYYKDDSSDSSSTFHRLYWNILPEQFTYGDVFTFSFYAKGTGQINARFYGDTSSYIKNRRIASNSTVTGEDGVGTLGDGNTVFAINSSWKKYYVTWQLASSGDDPTRPKTVQFILYGGNTAYVSNVQLERGYNATDYNEQYLTSSAISGMLTTSDVANNLTTTTTGKVLDARQGKALADLIGDAITYINQ